MPIYEYQCRRGHLEERIFSPNVLACPLTCSICGQPAERIMSLPAPARGKMYDSQNPPEVKRVWDNKFGKFVQAHQEV